MAFFHQFSLLIVSSVLFHGLSVKCQPPDLQSYQSTSACFGVYSDETNVNATCSSGHVIAVGNVTVGAKPESVGCPLTYNASFDFFTCCTYNQASDCLFPLYSENTIYHEECSGLQTCYKQAQRDSVGDKCTSVSGNFSFVSHFMFMDHLCIEDDKIVETCSGSTTLTKENTELYIWNKDFPSSSIQPTDTSCNCSIEIDNCQAGISIYTMYRQLTGNGAGTCNQTIRVGDGENNTVLLEWSCVDNTRDFETNTIQNTYILINLENQRNTTDGKFWLGFGATSDSNITASCPPTPQQYCVQTTTRTTTSITTVTTAITNITTDNSTEPSNTTTTTSSTTAPTSLTTAIISAATTVNETSTTEEISRRETDTNLLVALILLGVVVATLVIVVIILTCCLYRSCSTKTDKDAEKVGVDRSQPLPPPDVTKDLDLSASTPAPDFLPSLNAQDFGWQAKIDQIYIKENTAAQDLKLKADNFTKENEEIPIVREEFGCQVDLVPLAIQTKTIKNRKKAKNLVCPVEKGNLTTPISQPHRLYQTDKLQKRSQKIQADIDKRTAIKTSGCHTDAFLKDETVQEESEVLTTLPNGTLPKSLCDERETVPKKSGGVIPDKHLKKMKKKTTKRGFECNEDPYPTSQASLKAVSPEVKHESPANQRFLNKPETEMDEDIRNEADAEGPERYDNGIRTIHVMPESPTLDNIYAEVKHMLHVRSKIAHSFFGKERHEERLIRMINKQSRKVRKKKK